MKKVLITLAIILIVFIAALFAIPYLFKGDIIRIIQNQAEKHINAKVDIGDIQLSMFKSFPNLNVSVDDIIVSGKEEFSNDTVAFISRFDASVNLKSLISGDEIVVNRILLKDSRLAPTVAASGKANWDILMSGDTTVSPNVPQEAATKTDPKLQLNDIAIEQLKVVYKDHQNLTFADVNDVNMSLSGNFSESNTTLHVGLKLNDISFQQGNNTWVSQTDVAWQAEIAANLKDLIFELKESNILINDLQLAIAGSVAMQDDKSKVNLKLNAPDTKFESLLALMPKSFRHYLSNVQTTGDFTLDATAEGEVYANHLPAFNVRLAVNNAHFQYSGMPEAIRQINMDLNIANPGGSIDSTTIDLKRLAFDIAGNPFHMFLQVANLNDPLLKGGVNGIINFSSLKKALPLQDITLEGVITTNLTFDGKYQYIEKEQYEKFIAKGNVDLKNILFKNQDFPEGISIPQGSLSITPAMLNLSNLQAKVNSSDFTLKGSLSNYLPYMLKGGTLKGNFTLNSNMLNLNEFMASSAQPATKTDTTQRAASTQKSANASSTEGSVLEIPRNLDIQLTTNAKTILFDNLTITEATGSVILANASAILRNLKMNLLNGTMVMNGQYNTSNPQFPTAAFSLDVANFDVNAAFKSFAFIRQSLPIAMNCQGQVSSDMKFSATFDKNMDLIMKSVNGSGFIESKGLVINENPVMDQLASFLKNDELSRLSASYLKVNFKIQDGNIILEPFTTMIAGNPATIYGQQSVEGQLNYTLSANINRKYFGKEINNLLQAIPGSNNIENLDVDVKLGGTLDKPTIKPDLSKAINKIKKEAEKELKNKAKDEIMNGLEKLFKKK